MFIHLAKRIAMPNETLVTKCAWNTVDGFVAAGGVDGLVKVIKLELPEGKKILWFEIFILLFHVNYWDGDARVRGVAGQAQLTKNQTLEILQISNANLSVDFLR